MIKAIVTGSRELKDKTLVYRTLDLIKPTVLIHGDCRGTDRIAGAWAKDTGTPCIPYPANWNLGKRGGPIRNGQMLADHKDGFLLAFPGNDGTEDCIKQAKLLGLIVLRVEK